MCGYIKLAAKYGRQQKWSKITYTESTEGSEVGQKGISSTNALKYPVTFSSVVTKTAKGKAIIIIAPVISSS